MVDVELQAGGGEAFGVTHQRVGSAGVTIRKGRCEWIDMPRGPVERDEARGCAGVERLFLGPFAAAQQWGNGSFKLNADRFR